MDYRDSDLEETEGLGSMARPTSRESVDYEARYPEYFPSPRTPKPGLEADLSPDVLRSALDKMKPLRLREFISKPELLILVRDLEAMGIQVPQNPRAIPSRRLYRILQDKRKSMQAYYNTLK